MRSEQMRNNARVGERLALAPAVAEVVADQSAQFIL